MTSKDTILEAKLESVQLSLTVAARNVKTMQRLNEAGENPFEGPQFQFVAINLQAATATLRDCAQADVDGRGGSPIIA